MPLPTNVQDQDPNHAGLHNEANSKVNEVEANLAAHASASDPHAQYQLKSEKDLVNGYPSLDGTGKIPVGQLPRLLEGNGPPEGVVTAPPGTHYVDLDATRGAVEWVKASGTGNTGWRVSHADTGTRDVTSLLINGWTAVTGAGVFVRRIGNLVTVIVKAIDGSLQTDGQFMTLPSGFHCYVVPAIQPAVQTNPSFDLGFFTSTSGGALAASKGSAGALTGTRVYGTLTYITADAWPTSLPGVAG